MRQFWRRNTVEVPADLDAVTHRDASEGEAFASGIPEAQRERIWDAVLDMYSTGYQPGISLCLRRHGRIVLNRSIGHARGNGPGESGPLEPMLPSTPVNLFSASKSVTAMLVHWLAEQDFFSLDDRIADFVPEFGRHGKHRVTIHDMLAHRAGIAAIPAEMSPERFDDPRVLIEALCEAVPRHAHRPAYHPLTGGFILGELVERVTGRPVTDLLDRVLRQPLGMAEFTYGVSPDRNHRVARNYFVGPSYPAPLARFAEQIFGVEFERGCELSNAPIMLNNVVPSGNLVATAEETCRYFQMLLDGGEFGGRRVVRPDTVSRMVQPADRHRIDRTLLLPMRYSAGMMLGNPLFSLFGPHSAATYGHLGFINIVCWADPLRDVSGALLTTGKTLFGPHLLGLAKLLTRINTSCTPDRRSVAAPGLVLASG